jgi:hypothetical protein
MRARPTQSRAISLAKKNARAAPGKNSSMAALRLARAGFTASPATARRFRAATSLVS